MHRLRLNHCAALCYASALLTMLAGLLLSANAYPNGFDWVFTVASALASQKHNPDGSVWFALGMSLSMLLLWLYVSALRRHLSTQLSSPQRLGWFALRVGIVSGFLLGTERLLIYDLSKWLYKSHEFIALFTLAGFYIGVISLLTHLARHQRRYLLHVLLVLSPIFAIGITQLILYLDQRDLGWVNTSWRAKGISVWLSFALWQWLAIAFLWLALGLLLLFTRRNQHGERDIKV